MIYGKTNIGLVRETNEDAIYYDAENKMHLMIVADGIGGHARGEVASQKAVTTLKNYLIQHFDAYKDKEKLLEDGFREANAVVHAFQERLPDDEICGTTLTCAFFDKDHLYFGHVGDSRIYVSRNKHDIEQITHDHTYLSELARNDFKTFVELQENNLSRANNYLTRAIGPEKTIKIQVGHFRLKKNDYIILLTDGIYRYLRPLDILRLLKETTSIIQFVNVTMEKVLELGGKDNLSIIIGVHSESEGRS
ncbi:MAG: protein phosphatase 2C domain-containing protein [Peptococcaceae bacterium]|nr:protein phosphatase 2C domain-containing protein [Peptococcaceae bacterium]